MSIVKMKRAKAHGWLGLKSYANTKTRIGCPLDRFGKPVTGLTPEDETELELALGLDKGTLNRNNVFWTDFFVDIFDGTITLDTEVPEHRLQHKFLTAQKKVAKSMAELKTNANAIFVMYNEEDEAAKENKRNKNTRLAYRLFDEMSTEDMANVLMLYGKPAGSTSPSMIENTLQKLIDEDATTFLAHAGDPKMKMKVFVLRLVRAGILAKKGPGFAEYGSEDILAYDMEGMINYLEAKTNNAKLLQFKQALKGQD